MFTKFGQSLGPFCKHQKNVFMIHNPKDSLNEIKGYFFMKEIAH